MSKQLNITQKLAKARVMLQEKGLNKSGVNNFSHFEYFELKDFLPQINNIFDEIGLLGIFNLEENNAQLKIVNTDNPEEELNFITPVAEPPAAKMSDIQRLGSKHTYLKRYLYFNALEIAENDKVESLPQEEIEIAPQEAATEAQVKLIKKLYGNRVKGMLDYFQIKDLSELSKEAASNLISIEQSKQQDIKEQPEPKKTKNVQAEQQVSINDLK